MNILLDHCVPAPIKKHLIGHHVMTAFEMNWSQYRNGDLLRAAEGRFDVIITVDKSIEFQQALGDFEIAKIVIRTLSNTVLSLLSVVPHILAALETIKPHDFIVIATEDFRTVTAHRASKAKSEKN